MIARVTIDGVSADSVPFRVVPDDTQPTDVFNGRTTTELPHMDYYKIYNQLIFAENKNTPVANTLIEENNTVQMEKNSVILHNC